MPVKGRKERLILVFRERPLELFKISEADPRAEESHK
jgi:3-polyprenyl-4-hydroxybenzoate decarboxylase